MANNLVSLAGWYFLPNLVTGYVQTALYAIFIRAGDPKPVPGSQRFARDRRNIHIAVIVVYLLYTIYEADYQLVKDGDFYALLGVPHDVGEKTLQSKFRRLTVQYHPDKVPAAVKPTAEALYIQLKLARDTLVDPAKRFAYDRFGMDILGWQTCKTIPDFIFKGLQNISVYYLGSAGVLVLIGVLGYFKQGIFWRYLILASLFVIELYTASRPTFPTALTNFINPALIATSLRRPYLPYQMIILLRKLTLTFFIAMSQLGPLLSGTTQADAQGGGEIPAQQLDRIDALTQATDQELSRLMGLELTPFATEQSAAQNLRSGLKDWLVQNTIHNDPEVKTAIQAVAERRRRESQQPQ